MKTRRMRAQDEPWVVRHQSGIIMGVVPACSALRATECARVQFGLKVPFVSRLVEESPTVERDVRERYPEAFGGVM